MKKQLIIGGTSKGRSDSSRLSSERGYSLWAISDISEKLEGLGIYLKMSGFDFCIFQGWADFQGEYLIRRQECDAVILDLVLKSGMSSLGLIKPMKRLKDIPVMIYTSDMTREQEALEMGADIYLVKQDIEIRDLADRIEELIKNHA